MPQNPGGSCKRGEQCIEPRDRPLTSTKEGRTTIDDPTKGNSGRGNYLPTLRKPGDGARTGKMIQFGVKWKRGGVRQGRPDRYASTPTLF